MKTVKSLWQNSIESVSRITDRVREAFAPKQVVSPAHAQSGRMSVWDPAMYRSQVDDSRLYRDSSRRSEDSVPSERLLVKTSGTSVGLRNRGYGSQDRYLTIVADVAEYEVKQGLSGTVTAGGLPQVENKQQLKPLLARGLAYDQGEFERMARSNPVARNAIRATVERVAQASEYYCAPDIDWEALVYQPGITASGRAVLASKVRESTERAAEVLNLEWYHNPDVDPSQVIREQAYAMVPGFVLHEFGIDSRLQGRRRTTFVEHRAQSSVLRWLWDQNERWCGVVQNASGSPGLLADIPVTGVTVQGMPVIDSRKLLLVTNQRVGLNLEGLSDLRAAWYASQGKTEWFVSALMHRRKWGNGFPVFRLDADSAKAKGVSDSIASAAKDFFYSGQAYMGLPPGVTMEMLEFDSDTGFIVAMEYFDKEILRSLGALATEIGQSGGSYNLMEVQQQERLRQLEGYAQQIKSSRKSWIEAACSILIGDLAVLPELKIEGIMTRSDSEVLTIWEKVATIRNMTRPDGLPVYTDNDIRTLCDTVGVPFSTEEEVREAEASKKVVEQVSDEGISVVQEQVANDQVEQGIDQSSNVLEGETEKPSAPAPEIGVGGVRRRAAKTLADVDTKPSEAMAGAAARGLEWRKEYGRGGTEVGVARARDIANRKNLSEDTVRRMKAFFDRHQSDSKAEGFESGEDGFPSAGRIAHELWGGEAGFGWAERKVAEFNSVREQVKQRQSVKKKKVLPVTVVGRDGAKFATYRELMPIEKCVAWASLYLLTDSETTDTARAVNRRMKEHALEYAELASSYIKKGAMPPDTIANKFKPEVYEAIISTRLTQWAEITSKQMKTEIRSQVGSQFLPEADDKLFGAELKAIVAANAATLAKRLNDDLNARLMAAASQSALGSRNVMEVAAMPLAKETYKKWTLATVNIVNNFVREETARLLGPPIKQVTYSAIMDQDTCPECSRLDGTTYVYGSPAYIANRPPNQKCLSKLGPYGNVCRCIYVYAFKDTTGSAGGSLIEQ
jgi:hypothetical protein